MPNAEEIRKAPLHIKRFRAALAHAGMTASEWATANDVTPAHLSRVLWAKLDSRSLNEKIEAFTKAELKRAKAVA